MPHSHDSVQKKMTFWNMGANLPQWGTPMYMLIGVGKMATHTVLGTDSFLPALTSSNENKID